MSILYNNKNFKGGERMALIPWRRRKGWIWDPFKELEELHRRMDKLFDFWHGEEIEEGFFPAVDVYEKGNNIIVKAELPGMKKDEIEVHFDRDRLVIRGEKKVEEEVKGKGSIRTERYYGKFERVIPIPCEIDEENIKASYKNGVLEVILPKKGEKEQKGKIIDIEE